MPANYTADEEKAVIESLRSGDPAECPRCGGDMARTEVPPRTDVSYVRDRIWLVCRGCGRSVLTDRRRLADE